MSFSITCTRPRPNVFLKKNIMHDVLAAEKDSPCAAFELGLERMLSNAPSRVSESKYATLILVHRLKRSQERQAQEISTVQPTPPPGK